MTDRGVSAMMSTSLKLGADVSVAAGPVGGGAEASTANISADILTFTRAKGLYGGISLEGAVVATRGGLNDAFYAQKDLTPTESTGCPRQPWPMATPTSAKNACSRSALPVSASPGVVALAGGVSV